MTADDPTPQILPETDMFETDQRTSPGSQPQRGTSDVPADDANDVNPSEAFKEAGDHLREAGEYLSYYVSAKLDAFKASFLRLGLLLAAGVVLLLVGTGAIVAAGVLLVTGLAGALSALWHGPRWTGDLAVGLLFVGLIVVATLIMRSKVLNFWRQETIKRYESRREQQRRDFGHDVTERAQEADA